MENRETRIADAKAPPFRVLAFAFMLAGASACSFGLDLAPRDQTFYTIVERPEATTSSAQPLPVDVIIRDTRATPFLSGKKIVFGESAQTRGYYQFAAWVEPLPKRFSALLVRALQASGQFRSVAKSSLSARADVELVTELVDAYHLTDSIPGSVEIIVDADLLQTRTGLVLAHQRFVKHVPSQSYDATGAVTAIQHGVHEVIDDIAKWIASAVTAR